jgi:hypothetical protein
MTLPERLLFTADDEFTLRVLRSAEDDRPSASAYAATARTLGIGLGATATCSATALAAASASKGAAIAPTVLLGASKWAGLGIALGLATASAGYELARWVDPGPSGTSAAIESTIPSPPPERVVTRSPDNPQIAPLAERGVVPAAPRVPLPRAVVSDRASALPLVSTPASAATGRLTDLPTPTPASNGNTARAEGLSDEVARLDRVRAALQHHDGKTALGELDDYDRSGTRHLAMEATMLRIEALLESGERERAQRLAADLLGQRPPARIAERLRIILQPGQPAGMSPAAAANSRQ